MVYWAGKTNSGTGSGSNFFHPAGKSTPGAIVTRYSPVGSRARYSPSRERNAEMGRPLARCKRR